MGASGKIIYFNGFPKLLGYPVPPNPPNLDHDLAWKQPWWRLGIPQDLRNPPDVPWSWCCLVCQTVFFTSARFLFSYHLALLGGFPKSWGYPQFHCKRFQQINQLLGYSHGNPWSVSPKRAFLSVAIFSAANWAEVRGHPENEADGKPCWPMGSWWMENSPRVGRKPHKDLEKSCIT